jgi:protein tyrosine phosphatase
MMCYSSGCGRTGTFCTIDTVIKQLDRFKLESYEDLLFNTVTNFKTQRKKMVQNVVSNSELQVFFSFIHTIFTTGAI